jgi:hypothetical protein
MYVEDNWLSGYKLLCQQLFNLPQIDLGQISQANYNTKLGHNGTIGSPETNEPTIFHEGVQP